MPLSFNCSSSSKTLSSASKNGATSVICEPAGAYGFTMSSNYNTRPRVAEVMVANTTHQLVRKRETAQDLFSGECLYEV
jgi:hypothetical protein